MHYKPAVVVVVVVVVASAAAAAEVEIVTEKSVRSVLKQSRIRSSLSAVTVHRCLRSQAPKYLADYCDPVSYVAFRHPWSTAVHQLTVPIVRRSTFGFRASDSAGPTVWIHWLSVCVIKLLDMTSSDLTWKRSSFLSRSVFIVIKVFLNIIHYINLHLPTHNDICAIKTLSWSRIWIFIEKHKPISFDFWKSFCTWHANITQPATTITDLKYNTYVQVHYHYWISVVPACCKFSIFEIVTIQSKMRTVAGS